MISNPLLNTPKPQNNKPYKTNFPIIVWVPISKEDFKNRDIVSAKDFSREDLEFIFDVSQDVKENPKKFRNILNDKIVAMTFFEPSTRTYQSFQTAAKILGCNVISFSEPNSSSYGGKGESFHDTIKILENYSDCIVIRHPSSGSAKYAAEISNKPVINAGSGFQEHPTQTMLDLFTIRSELGKIDNLSIGILGDLRYGRGTTSLCYALTNYNAEINLIAPEALQIRPEIETYLGAKGANFNKFSNLKEIISELDVLYVTRIQKERFVDPNDYMKVKGSFKVTMDSLKDAKDSLIVLHILPRIDEISTDIDSTKFARYFEQAKNGLFVRTALLSLILAD